MGNVCHCQSSSGVSETLRDRQRSTIIDIARAAGVSVSTVSRIINGKSDVSLSTKQLVLDTLLAHEFKVNPMARSLVGARRG
jgi:DNA-binding LacI/PurR family transcriptional regulator